MHGDKVFDVKDLSHVIGVSKQKISSILKNVDLVWPKTSLEKFNIISKSVAKKLKISKILSVQDLYLKSKNATTLNKIANASGVSMTKLKSILSSIEKDKAHKDPKLVLHFRN